MNAFKNLLLVFILTLLLGSLPAIAEVDCDSPPDVVGYWEWTGTWFYSGDYWVRPDGIYYSSQQYELGPNGEYFYYQEEELFLTNVYTLRCTEGESDWYFGIGNPPPLGTLDYIRVIGSPGSRTMELEDPLSSLDRTISYYEERDALSPVSASTVSWGTIKAQYR